MSTEISTDSTPAQGDTAGGPVPDAPTSGPTGDTGTPPVVTPDPATAPDQGATPPTDGTPAEPKPDDKAPPAPVKLVLPEGSKPSDMARWFEGIAQEKGLGQDQAQAVFDAWNALQAESVAAQNAAFERAEAVLKNEWQKDYDKNLAVSQRAAKELFSASCLDKLNATGMGTDPEFLRGLLIVGKALSEDSVRTGLPAPLQDARAAKLLYPNQK